MFSFYKYFDFFYVNRKRNFVYYNQTTNGKELCLMLADHPEVDCLLGKNTDTSLGIIEDGLQLINDVVDVDVHLVLGKGDDSFQ